MKFAVLIFSICALFSAKVFACEDEPTMANAGKILKVVKIEEQRGGKSNDSNAVEIGLFVKASVGGAAWQKAGAEAAVLTVFVDGKYNQDAILFAGERVFEYQMLLGKYDSSAHKITLVLNEKHSAPNAKNVRLKSASATRFEDLSVTKPSDSSLPAYFATLNSPIIYLRPDTIDKFSDVPLLTYYEIFDEPENVKRIRYTTVFTNEDGGTQSAALMARWGRMTDIEWIYEMRVNESGAILSEIYQAANHETKNFEGARFGAHPLILDATVNNNFADAGCTALRVSPILIQTNLSNGSRETVMDNNPWTYRIMAEEAIREGRINPAKLGANAIADPRDYAYAEIHSDLENAALAFEIKSADGKIYSSDTGNKLLRVNRPGFVRIALRMPTEILQSTNFTAAVGCYAVSPGKESVCRNLQLLKIVRLDRDYLPRETKIESAPQTIKSGETLLYPVRFAVKDFIR